MSTVDRNRRDAEEPRTTRTLTISDAHREFVEADSRSRPEERPIREALESPSATPTTAEDGGSNRAEVR